MNKILTSTIITILLITVVILSWLLYQTRQEGDFLGVQIEQTESTKEDPLKNQLVDETPEGPITIMVSILPANVFDVEKAGVGDAVENLIISSIEQKFSLSATDVSVGFTGEIEVTGSFKYYDETDVFLAGLVCFDQLTDKTLRNLPIILGDTRLPWFCFNDGNDLSIFGSEGNSGHATVTINNYVIKYFPGEVWNTADLVQVTSISNQ